MTPTLRGLTQRSRPYSPAPAWPDVKRHGVRARQSPAGSSLAQPLALAAPGPPFAAGVPRRDDLSFSRLSLFESLNSMCE